jgi:hypothetical protein
MNQTGVGSLTHIDAAFAEVVVQTIDLCNAGQSVTANIVGVAAILIDPPVQQALVQGVLIREFLVDILEVAALFSSTTDNDILVVKRQQTESFLVFRLGG